MVPPAQTYVPQRATGVLWPHRSDAPIRPVGCMRGLGSIRAMQPIEDPDKPPRCA